MLIQTPPLMDAAIITALLAWTTFGLVWLWRMLCHRKDTP